MVDAGCKAVFAQTKFHIIKYENNPICNKVQNNCIIDITHIKQQSTTLQRHITYG